MAKPSHSALHLSTSVTLGFSEECIDPHYVFYLSPPLSPSYRFSLNSIDCWHSFPMIYNMLRNILYGVVHWVPVLSNIKTATGCESNRQLQLWTVFAGTVVNNYQFNGIQGWAGQLCQISCRAVIERMPKEVFRNTSFSGGIAMKYRFIQPLVTLHLRELTRFVIIK